jgi:hypothetical protein
MVGEKTAAKEISIESSADVRSAELLIYMRSLKGYRIAFYHLNVQHTSKKQKMSRRCARIFFFNRIKRDIDLFSN